MSDVTPLNDPELNHLEEHLTAVTLTPTSRRRERLLYACGHAAGREEMRRRARGMTAATVLLASVSAGLSFVLLTRNAPDAIVLKQTVAPVVETERTDSRITVLPREQPELGDNRRWQLTAGTKIDQLLTFERTQKTEPLNAELPELPPVRVLTAASRWWPDEFWD